VIHVKFSHFVCKLLIFGSDMLKKLPILALFPILSIFLLQISRLHREWLNFTWISVGPLAGSNLKSSQLIAAIGAGAVAGCLLSNLCRCYDHVVPATSCQQ